MKMILIDTSKEKAEVVTVKEDKLETYYELLKCQYIEIVEREIHGVRFNIICDEEGKFKENKLSGVMKDNSDFFVGNILLCGLGDKKGNLTGLKGDDIDIIMNYIVSVSCEGEEELHPVVFELEY